MINKQQFVHISIWIDSTNLFFFFFFSLYKPCTSLTIVISYPDVTLWLAQIMLLAHSSLRHLICKVTVRNFEVFMKQSLICWYVVTVLPKGAARINKNWKFLIVTLINQESSGGHYHWRCLLCAADWWRRICCQCNTPFFFSDMSDFIL